MLIDPLPLAPSADPEDSVTLHLELAGDLPAPTLMQLRQALAEPESGRAG